MEYSEDCSSITKQALRSNTHDSRHRFKEHLDVHILSGKERTSMKMSWTAVEEAVQMAPNG